MKKGDKINYTKYGIPAVATVSIVEAYHVIAHDGPNTILFKK